MIKKRVSLIFIALLLMCGSSFAQSGRLNDLASRLANDAADFADNSYRNYANSGRGRTDVNAAMLAQQFSATAQLFNRMVNDRLRAQDIREAFQVVQNMARSIDRNNNQQNRWGNIQRTLSDIGREVDYYGPGPEYPNPYPGGGSSSGSMTWKGRVDDDVRITITGGSAYVKTLGGTPFPDGVANFSAALPPRRVNVKLNVKKSRGEVYIEQQPSRENDYSVVIRILDKKSGASDYEFEISW
ncbi:MAG: hypothetical protein C5B55_09585 [Blastocatellia bacterium]|nr:MAG: hypothetical protein C5B55_09585 [Blastocatellia bacterium]